MEQISEGILIQAGKGNSITSKSLIKGIRTYKSIHKEKLKGHILSLSEGQQNDFLCVNTIAFSFFSSKIRYVSFTRRLCCLEVILKPLPVKSCIIQDKALLFTC